MIRRAHGRAGIGRAVAIGLLAVAAVGVGAPVAVAASDVFSNVGPASQLPGGSLADRYPLGHYALDIHFKAVEAGVFDGVDMSGVPPTIAWFLASLLWELTAFVAKATITLFTFAFSLDLVNGSATTGGTGALEPVSRAVRSIYRTVFGGPWLAAGIVVTGMWAMWHALVRRRYTDTAAALGTSLVFLVIALAFVTQPEQTVGRATGWANDLSSAFLSLSTQGGLTDPGRAKREAADQLFELLVHDPWVVLQFGGLEHCVRAPVNDDDPVSVAVRPLSSNPARDAALSRRLARSEQVRADGKVCVSNRNKYAHRFLQHPPHSEERDRHYEALRDGDVGEAPEQDRDGYALGAADEPAADAMGKGGQYQRLLMATIVFAGELGAFVLLGSLSVAVVLAQVLVLLLLAFAPVALVAGVIPGRGHDFFKGWLARLAGFLARKAIYSLILAVVLAVASAVGQATSNLGWLMAFGLQGAFFWTVFLFRHKLTGQATQLLTGHQAAEKAPKALGLASIYAAAHMAGRHLPGRRPPQPDNDDRPEDARPRRGGARPVPPASTAADGDGPATGTGDRTDGQPAAQAARSVAPTAPGRDSAPRRPQPSDTGQPRAGRDTARRRVTDRPSRHEPGTRPGADDTPAREADQQRDDRTRRRPDQTHRQGGPTERPDRDAPDARPDTPGRRADPQAADGDAADREKEPSPLARDLDRDARRLQSPARERAPDAGDRPRRPAANDDISGLPPAPPPPPATDGDGEGER